MKEVMITLLLLLFDISFNNGHTLSKIDLNNPADVYEMKEDKSSLAITYPKDDKNILREIIYYHIIEKPYEGFNNKVKESPAVDNIKRTFTNGHGLQYLDHIDDPKTEDDINEEQELNTDTSDEEYEEDDEEIETTTGTNSKEAVKSDTKVLVDDKQITTDENEAKKFTDIVEKIMSNDTVGLDIRFREVDHTITEEPVIEEKLASRKKREIDYTNLPDAPSLPEINLDILPDYIKAILMEEPDSPLQANRVATFEEEIDQQVRNLEKAANHPPSVEDGDNYKRKEDKTYGMSLAGDVGEIWNDLNAAPVSYIVGELENFSSTSKLEEILTTTIASFDDSTEDRDDNEELEDDKLADSDNYDNEQPVTARNFVKLDIRFGEEDNTPVTEALEFIGKPEIFTDEMTEQMRNLENEASPSIGNKEDQKREVRTYGMSLAGDSGVVWNDLNSPLVKYHVGEPEIITSTLKPIKTEEISKTTTISATDESAEETSFEEDNNENDSVGSGDVDRDAKEIEESFDEIEKMFKELIKDSTIKPEVTSVSNKDESTKNPGSQEENKPTETPNKKPTDKDETPDNENENKSNKPDEEKETNDRKDKNKDTNKHKDEESKQQQFVKELIKNKYFWEWLKDSSTAYLEIMMKKVDALIKTEVEKQIKQYFEEHKNVTVNYKPDKGNADENTTLEENPDKISNVTNVYENITTTETPIVTSTEPSKPSNDTVVDKKNTANETRNEELTKKHKDKESNDKTTEMPVKIEAQNVYGNSVSNGRVTNIFIFNISNSSDLENFKPIKNGTNGIFIFGLDDKKPSQEGNSTTTDKPTLSDNKTTKRPSNNNLNVTTLKPNIDKESNVTEEVIEQTTMATTELLKDSKEDIITEKDITEAPTTETIKETTASSTTKLTNNIGDITSNDSTTTSSENENVSPDSDKTVTPEIKETETTTEKSSTENISTDSDSIRTTESN